MASSFERVVEEMARERAATAFQIDAPAPDMAARANRMARIAKVPADTADRNLDRLQRMNEAQRMRQLVDRNPELARPMGDPRVAAVARDDADGLQRLSEAHSRLWSKPAPAVPDAIGRSVEQRAEQDKAWFASVDSFAGRAGALATRGLANLEEGLTTVGAVLNEWSADNPLPWTSNANRAAEREAAKQLRLRSALLGGVSSSAVRGETTWEGVKAAPNPGNVLAFGVESLFGSAAQMAAAGIALPALVTSQAGNIGTQRARNNGRTEASGGDVVRALPAALASAALERIGVSRIIRPGGATVAGRIGRAGATEALTEAGQSSVEYAGGALGTDKGFQIDEAADQVLAGVVGGGVSGVTLRGGAELSAPMARRIVRPIFQSSVAVAESDALDGLAEVAAQSKTRQRDPEAFASLVAALRGDAGEDVFVPGERVLQYLQSDNLHDREFWDGYREQAAEAAQTGGDVVIPVDRAISFLSGTPAWEALRDDMRLSPGGISLREASEMDTDFEGVIETGAREAEAGVDAAQAADAPRRKLFDNAYAKLTNAGYTPDAARLQADVIAQRYATRAARTGAEFTGDEFGAVDVRQVLPEGLAPLRSSDTVDMVIAAMRRGADPNAGTRRKSLIEFIAQRGGITDEGGDLASMGADRWHTEKRFRRRLLRDAVGPDMLGGGDNRFSPDTTLTAAIEAGYFPELNFTRDPNADFTDADAPDARVLLDAIDAELRGLPRYAEEAVPDRLRAMADELSQMLDQSGIDPASASPADIRQFLQRFSEEAEGGVRFDQGEGQALDQSPRGRVTFQDGRAIIELFEKRNLSTLVHELGHVWLEELRFDAGSNDGLAADWQAVTEWFAANGHPVAEDGSIPVEAHEMWARGVERFVMEGKAPTTALRAAFDAIKSWMLTIYDLVVNLRAPISPEIRNVMERLLATDEEIEASRADQGIDLLFVDAQAAGMTDAEYAAYQATATDARNEARDGLLFKVMASVRASRTKEYRDQRAGVREDVAADVDARREFRALAMVAGDMKLDRDAITAEFGADALDLLPKRVPPIFTANGSSLDAVAELAGYRTGNEMVRALMGIEARRVEMRAAGDKRSVRDSVIEEETDAVMSDRYGDPLADGSIEREARELIHSDMQGDVIAAELRALSRLRPASSNPSQAPTPYQAARRWAERKVAEGEVREYASRGAIARYQRSARKAAREAEQAMIAGNIDEAYRAKQVQMLNNALVSEATKAANSIDAAVTRMGKIAKRRTIKSVDQDYLEQAQALLEAVELRQRSQVSIDRQGAFEAWAAAREAEGHDVVVPASFEASLGTTNYTRMTVERLIGLDQAVSQIIHLGRRKQSMLDGRDQREFDAIVSEGVAAAGQLPPRPPSDLMEPSWADRFKSKVASFDAALLKMETVFDWLDGGNSNGVFNRIAFQPIAAAEARQTEMQQRYNAVLLDHLQALPPEAIKRWADKVEAPELINRETGNPFVLTRDQLVSIALNMGNEGNIQRLTDGYGWSEVGVRSALARELSEPEWAYVQAVWDTLETLWPETAAMERRVNGVEPEKVEALPVETPFGTLRGGYYPAIYDPRRSAEAQANAARASDSLFENIYTRATTRASSTKDRAVKVSRPIHLSLGVMQQHVTEVIHDITHREAIMNADRFLQNPRIIRAIDETLGPEIRASFRPWLQHIANEFAAERSGAGALENFIKTMRTNATIVGMGFRVSTIFMQVAGYSNSFERVGARWVSEGIMRSIRDPIGVANFVFERSSEVRNRLGNLDRDIRDTIRLAQSSKNPLTEAKRFAFIGIGYMDRVVVVPTWLGAYNKALAAGMNEDAAIYEADKAVRQSQGAGAAKDLAAVQRGTGRSGEAFKLLTMFYSFMSALYQRQRTLGRDTGAAIRDRDAGALPGLLARAWWLLILPPVLAELLAGRGPEEDEDWGMWALQKMLLQFVGPIPLLRDLVGPALAAATDKPSFGYRFTPAAGGLETAVRLFRDAGNIAEGEPTQRATRNALEVAGYATGLVPGQVAAATQFLVDVGYGEQEPETISDWWEGLTKGKIKQD